jgi:exopolysaccharide production protein ExoQ
LGSKNQVGFIAEIGIYTGLLLAFTKIDKFQKLLFALIPLVICGVCLYMSRSATSVMSLTAMLSVLVGMYFVTRLPQGLRMPALVASIFAVATVIMFAVALDVSMVDTILGGFGKNSTLTGRTYLWAEGIKNGMEMPWLGHGYVSFWVVGQPQAELYWHEFLIGNRSGFHFHNLYVQTFVDLGAVGVTMVSLLLIGLCIASLRLVLRAGLGLETGLFLGLSFMFLVRSFAEVDILGPFGVGPLLFYAMIPQLAQARSIKNVVA